MTESETRYTFGPVPSRRLGRSLGVNNIPPKICSYSCIYCQVGRTKEMRIERQAFYDPDAVAQDVRARVKNAAGKNERIDYITFVPDGEPTLDIRLGKLIALLKPLGIPIGVISNASLMGREDVREELGSADWVSLKFDSVQEPVWRAVNRPHNSLRLASILDGSLAFAKAFAGKLVTETMLVEGNRDDEEGARKLADFLGRLRPHTAYVSIPTRPPAESWVRPPGEDVLNRTYQILREQVANVELLIGYEGDSFASTGEAETDLLNITAVHPMREEAVRDFLARAGAAWSLVEGLKARGELLESSYAGHTFFLRSYGGHSR
ncbi:MAG: radical SAM protein [Anaerolineales bacterium]|nr:radical SAM protein [Anaerolineales bacterium]